jgi:hypothetical protein
MSQLCRLRWMKGLLLLGACQGTLAAGIYTCTDKLGRRLSSDRLIPECADRDQRELSASGTVIKVHNPLPTAHELAVAEAKTKLAEAEKVKRLEARSRDRALLARYPNKAAHDRGRREAQTQAQAATQAAQARIASLAKARVSIDADVEFYAKDPSRLPAVLQRQVEDSDRDLAAQRTFVAEQAAERQRINARFDTELLLLSRLWVEAEAAAAGVPPASSGPAQ